MKQVLPIIFLSTLLTMLLLISSGCENETFITKYVHDTVYVPLDTVIGSFRISDIIVRDQPRVGDKFKIVLVNKPADMFINYLEINNLWTTIDSSAGDTIYAFWPLLPESNILSFKVDGYSYNPSTVYTTYQNMSFDYEVIEGIQIRPNNEETIDPENLYPPMLRGGDPTFSLSVNGDTVIISVVYTIHDEAGERLYWKFLDRGNELPELIEHTRHWNISDGSVTGTFYYDDTLKTGLIKIDKWNDVGIFSGIVYSQIEPYSIRSGMHPKITFWVRRN